MPESSVNPSPLIPATTPSCSRSRSGESPFATRRRGEWSVSARYSCPSARAAADHEVDRGESVRPVAVRVEVAAQQRPQLRRLLDPGALAQIGEVAGHLAGERLLDDREGRIADPLPATQGCGIPQLFVAQPRDRVGGGAERLRLVPRRSLALEERRDLGERVVRMHVRSARRPERGHAQAALRLLHDDRAPTRGGGTPSRTGWRGRPSRRRTARRRTRRPR